LESPPADQTPEEVAEDLGQETLHNLIHQQLQYLLAAFSLHPKPTNFLHSSGTIALRETPTIIETSYELKERFGADFLSLKYSYQDEAIFHRNVFAEGSEEATVEVRLPLYTEGYYELGFVEIKTALLLYSQHLDGSLDEIKNARNEGKSQINLCTDLHYNDLGDYWYFWNPYAIGCPLAAKRRTQSVTARVSAVPELADQKPAYKKMIQDRVLDVTYIVGVDSNFRNGDYGRETFRKAFQLLNLGRAALKNKTVLKKLTEGEMALLDLLPEGEDIRFMPTYDSSFEKKLELNRDGYTVKVHMVLADPGSEDPARWEKFRATAVNGLIHSDVFIYDGHSGLGGFLDPANLFDHKSKLSKLKSQIFFFNGCTTFPYYSQSFFDLKATESDPDGRRNLDIITTALGATFNLGAGQDVALIFSLALQSGDWSDIMDRLHLVFPEESALTYVVTE
jgi:hypothetical protein